MFGNILYKRLETQLEQQNILAKEQAGFRRNKRTSDHIFTLKTLVNKIIKKGKFLYTCFVDFKKAYDSVSRIALIHKLQTIGISGNFLNLIESMYSSTKASLFHRGKISESFETRKGVKQGDVLSTLLFNIFVNDLPRELEKCNIDTADIFNTAINSLLFADDLIVISLSKEGLQARLDILNEYCAKWGLTVNVKKTKVMIFNKSGSTIKKHKFFFQHSMVESVGEYTYLGFVFIPSGKMHKGILNLVNKARKAWFFIQKTLSNSKEKTVQTYLKLFESLIKPILLYASESWGDITTSKLYENKLEKLHLSICKQILGVGKRATNVKCLAELARYPLYTDIETQIFKYFQRYIKPFRKNVRMK